MKKFLAFILSGMMAVSLAACSETENQEDIQTQQTQQTQNDLQATDEEVFSEAPADENVPAEENDTNILIAYFSYGENTALPEGVDVSSTASIQVWNDDITGNTGVIANMIANATGGDLFSIKTVEKYPDSYDATIDQGQQEQSENARPELTDLPENLENYEIVFLGFPNWWGDMPMALYSFLDEVDLSGKTIIPFVTSGGSGFSSTISTIETMEENATVQEGISIRDSSAMEAQEEIEGWLSGLGYME